MISKDLKEKWITALQSGEFEQGKFTMWNPQKDTYCCLGVLAICMGEKKEAIANVPLNFSSNEVLGKEVVHKLIELNDTAGYSFEMIANFIESNVESIVENKKLSYGTKLRKLG